MRAGSRKGCPLTDRSKPGVARSTRQAGADETRGSPNEELKMNFYKLSQKGKIAWASKLQDWFRNDINSVDHLGMVVTKSDGGADRIYFNNITSEIVGWEFNGGNKDSLWLQFSLENGLWVKKEIFQQLEKEIDLTKSFIKKLNVKSPTYL